MDNKIIFFTNKAEKALEEIIKKFNLEESLEEFVEKEKNKKLSNIVLIDSLAKNFGLGEISDREVSKKLQQEVGLGKEVAEEITKEIIEKVVPFLEKVEEEKLKDSSYIEKLYKKISDIENYREEPTKEKTEDFFPKIDLEEITTETPKENKLVDPEIKIEEKSSIDINTIPPKKEKIKKPITTYPDIEQKKAPQKTGSDTYRESIE